MGVKHGHGAVRSGRWAAEAELPSERYGHIRPKSDRLSTEELLEDSGSPEMKALGSGLQCRVPSWQELPKSLSAALGDSDEEGSLVSKRPHTIPLHSPPPAVLCTPL